MLSSIGTDFVFLQSECGEWLYKSVQMELREKTVIGIYFIIS
jgi:hypothetical protein